jgi:hypothetical protein
VAARRRRGLTGADVSRRRSGPVAGADRDRYGAFDRFMGFADHDTNPCHRPWSPCEPRSACPPSSPHRRPPPHRPGGCPDRRRRRRRRGEPDRRPFTGRAAPRPGLRDGPVCRRCRPGHRDPAGSAGDWCSRPGWRGRVFTRRVPPVTIRRARCCPLDRLGRGRRPGRHGRGAENEQVHRGGRFPVGQRLPDGDRHEHTSAGVEYDGADHPVADTPAAQRAPQPAGPATHDHAPGPAADDHLALAAAVPGSRNRNERPAAAAATAGRSVML